ncbi:MAG: hypothetical protein HZC41_08525 [Chloroflexi bacterium]|nr:hypothetical protein [Chloroflexota bacterium]
MPRLPESELNALIEDIQNQLPAQIEIDGKGDKLWGQAKDALTYDFPQIELLKQFGTWAVTNVGVICLTQQSGHYCVRKENLGMIIWPRQLSEKSWCNLEDFLRAFYAARQIFSE